MIVPIVVGFVILVIVLGAVGYVIQIYNQLINLKKQTDQAWSNIDVLLKQRSDELPKIIDTVEQYMDYEQETLQQVVEARSKTQQADNPEQQAKADSELQNALGNLFAVAEDYPDLKANESFQQLQSRISSIEEQISDRRELYNESATNYNTLISQIPYVLIANQMNLSEKKLYEVDESEKEDIDVSDAFGDNKTKQKQNSQ